MMFVASFSPVLVGCQGHCGSSPIVGRSLSGGPLPVWVLCAGCHLTAGPQKPRRMAMTKDETLPPSPQQRKYHASLAKSSPKPLTPVNRESVVWRHKSRIYLHCGEAITLTAEQPPNLRSARQFCLSL